MITLFITLYILCGILSTSIIYNTFKKEYYLRFGDNILDDIKDFPVFGILLIIHLIISLLTGILSLIVTLLILTIENYKYITIYYKIPKK